MPDLTPSQNAPVTAASVTSAIGLCLIAFATLTAEQTTAILAVVGIAAAFVVQRYGTDPKP